MLITYIHLTHHKILYCFFVGYSLYSSEYATMDSSFDIMLSRREEYMPLHFFSLLLLCSCSLALLLLLLLGGVKRSRVKKTLALKNKTREKHTIIKNFIKIYRAYFLFFGYHKYSLLTYNYTLEYST